MERKHKYFYSGSGSSQPRFSVWPHYCWIIRGMNWYLISYGCTVLPTNTCSHIIEMDFFRWQYFFWHPSSIQDLKPPSWLLAMTISCTTILPYKLFLQLTSPYKLCHGGCQFYIVNNTLLRVPSKSIQSCKYIPKWLNLEYMHRPLGTSLWVHKSRHLLYDLAVLSRYKNRSQSTTYPIASPKASVPLIEFYTNHGTTCRRRYL